MAAPDFNFDLDKALSEIEKSAGKENFHVLVKELVIKHFDITRDSITDEIKIYYIKGKKEKDNPFENIEEISAIEISDFLNTRYQLNVSIQKVNQILHSKLNNRVTNTIIEYFNELVWNKTRTSHIDILASKIKASPLDEATPGDNQKRIAYYLKKWIFAAAAQLHGIYTNPVMLLFFSKNKGKGKTYLADYLGFNFNYQEVTGKPLHKLNRFSTNSKENTFEAENKLDDMLRRYFLINFDEMTGFKQKYYRKFRSVITSSQVNIKNKIYKRIASLVGSVNPESIEITENDRRLLIIEIDDVDFSYVTDTDIDQIYAEAMYYIREGKFDEFKFTQDDFIEIQNYNSRYVRKSREEFYILSYFRAIAEPAVPELMVNCWRASDIINEIMKDKIPESDKSKFSAVNFGRELRKLFNFKEDLWSNDYRQNINSVYFCEKINK